MGATCSVCAESFFGPTCAAVAAKTEVIPTSGPDVGGNVVSVLGWNFNATRTYRCVFGSTRANGTVVSSREVRCVVPASPSSTVGSFVVTLGLEEDGSTVVYGASLTYSYVGVCPPGSCVHGVCSRGSCVCSNGWLGADCNTAIVPVRVGADRTLQLREQETFVSAALDATGTAPITWQIVGGWMNGLSIGGTSGVLQWDTPVARGDAYVVTVEARNIGGTAQLRVRLQVAARYNVTISLVSVNEVAVGSGVDPVVVPREATLLLRGTIVPFDGQLSVQSQPVDVWIKRVGGTAKTVRLSTGTVALFQYRWTLGRSDVGRFIVGASHPSDTDRSRKQGPGFTVYGLQVLSDAVMRGCLGGTMCLGACRTLETTR